MINKSCDLNRVSQLFHGFKSTDMLEISKVLMVISFIRLVRNRMVCFKE